MQGIQIVLLWKTVGPIISTMQNLGPRKSSVVLLEHKHSTLFKTSKERARRLVWLVYCTMSSRYRGTLPVGVWIASKRQTLGVGSLFRRGFCF